MAVLKWKLHLNAAPEDVFRHLTTDECRNRFWVESSDETAGVIEFIFPDGQTIRSKILAIVPDKQFHMEYFGSEVQFDLIETEKGGTELTLTNTGVPEEEFHEVYAGWVSVLMSLKAAVDHGIDLRNHDSRRTWKQGFVDN